MYTQNDLANDLEKNYPQGVKGADLFRRGVGL